MVICAAILGHDSVYPTMDYLNFQVQTDNEKVFDRIILVLEVSNSAVGILLTKPLNFGVKMAPIEITTLGPSSCFFSFWYPPIELFTIFADIIWWPHLASPILWREEFCPAYTTYKGNCLLSLTWTQLLRAIFCVEIYRWSRIKFSCFDSNFSGKW